MNVGRAMYWMEKHLQAAWVIAFLAVTSTFGYWAIDYDPPFREVYYYRPAPVRAGEELALELDVERDLERRCSVSVSRFFLDSAGYRTDYSPTQFLNAEGIRKRESESAGKLRLRFRIPESMPAGPATLNTESLFACAWNPLHTFAPIRVSSSWPFEVLPPGKVKAIIIQEKE